MLVVVAMIVIIKACYKAIKNQQMNILATTCKACTEGNVCVTLPKDNSASMCVYPQAM